MTSRVFIQSDLLTEILVLEVPASADGSALKSIVLAKIPGANSIKELHTFLEDDDDDDPLNKLQSIPDGLRVHVHHLKGIAVEVRYAGKSTQRTFRPSSTVARVKTWATRDLGIAATDAADLMLQLVGTSIRPDADAHIGTLVHGGAHKLQFDLVPSPRING